MRRRKVDQAREIGERNRFVQVTMNVIMDPAQVEGRTVTRGMSALFQRLYDVSQQREQVRLHADVCRWSARAVRQDRFPPAVQQPVIQSQGHPWTAMTADGVQKRGRQPSAEVRPDNVPGLRRVRSVRVRFSSAKRDEIARLHGEPLILGSAMAPTTQDPDDKIVHGLVSLHAMFRHVAILTGTVQAQLGADGRFQSIDRVHAEIIHVCDDSVHVHFSPDPVGFVAMNDIKDSYQRDGYYIARRLFDKSDVDAIHRRFDEIGNGPDVPGYWVADRSEGVADPLKRYPRVMMPHRFDDLSKRYLLDRRIHDVLALLLGDEPVAAQSMFYYKPPGARGQAMHQDNFYLKVKPASCIAAWVAIDPARPENGGMFVVPGTHDMEIVCPDLADSAESWTTHLVHTPKGKKPVPATMEPGDCLFFNGSVIHGSGPNRHPTSWRRSFICHYIPASSSHIAKHYHPLLDFDGNVVTSCASSDDGGPCGEGVDVSKYGSYGKWH